MRALILLPLAALLACPGTKTKQKVPNGGDEETGTTSPDDTGEEEPPAFVFLSDSFSDGHPIPVKHACTAHGGDNISPQLHWENAPEASSFSIIMDDEVSPCGSGDSACRHWALFNIPADTDTLPEDFDSTSEGGVVEGLNYASSASYAGPCPPNAHVYKISLYVLSDSMPVIEPGVAYTRSQFEAEFAAEILAQDTIEGTFDPND